MMVKGTKLEQPLERRRESELGPPNSSSSAADSDSGKAASKRGVVNKGGVLVEEILAGRGGRGRSGEGDWTRLP